MSTKMADNKGKPFRSGATASATAAAPSPAPVAAKPNAWSKPLQAKRPAAIVAPMTVPATGGAAVAVAVNGTPPAPVNVSSTTTGTIPAPSISTAASPNITTPPGPPGLSLPARRGNHHAPATSNNKKAATVTPHKGPSSSTKTYGSNNKSQDAAMAAHYASSGRANNTLASSSSWNASVNVNNGSSNGSNTAWAVRERFLHLLLQLTGQKVTVTMRNGAVYTGIFHTATPFSLKAPEQRHKYVLKAVSVDCAATAAATNNSNNNSSNNNIVVEPGQTVVLDMHQVVDVHIKSLRLDALTVSSNNTSSSNNSAVAAGSGISIGSLGAELGGGAFTDTEISGAHSRAARPLVEAGSAWTTAAVTPNSNQHKAKPTSRADALLFGSEGSSNNNNIKSTATASSGNRGIGSTSSQLGAGGGLQGSIGAWDQFKANEELFNVKSSFDESLYTTELDKTALTADKVQEAERLAREIESTASANIHVAEERGHVLETDYDEEDKYSGVLKAAAAINRNPRLNIINSKLQGQNNSNASTPVAVTPATGKTQPVKKMNYAAVAAAAAAPALVKAEEVDITKDTAPVSSTAPVVSPVAPAALSLVSKGPVKASTIDAAVKPEETTLTGATTETLTSPKVVTPVQGDDEQPDTTQVVTEISSGGAAPVANFETEIAASTTTHSVAAGEPTVDTTETTSPSKDTPLMETVSLTGDTETTTDSGSAADESKRSSRDDGQRQVRKDSLNASRLNANAPAFKPGLVGASTPPPVPQAPPPILEHQPPHLPLQQPPDVFIHPHPQLPHPHPTQVDYQQPMHHPAPYGFDPNTGLPITSSHVPVNQYGQPVPMGHPGMIHLMNTHYHNMRFPGHYQGMEQHMQVPMPGQPPIVAQPQPASAYTSGAPSPVPASSEEDVSLSGSALVQPHQQAYSMPDGGDHTSVPPSGLQLSQQHLQGGPMQQHHPFATMPYNMPGAGYYGAAGGQIHLHMNPMQPQHQQQQQQQRVGQGGGVGYQQPFQQIPMVRSMYAVPGAPGGMPPNMMRSGGGGALPYYHGGGNPGAGGPMPYPSYGGGGVSSGVGGGGSYDEDGGYRGGGRGAGNNLGRGRGGRGGRGRSGRGGRGSGRFNNNTTGQPGSHLHHVPHGAHSSHPGRQTPQGMDTPIGVEHGAPMMPLTEAASMPPSMPLHNTTAEGSTPTVGGGMNEPTA